MSAGWPIRPSGVMPAMWLATRWVRSAAASPSRPREKMGVSTPPGFTQLTRMPCGPCSWATERVKATTPALQAEYTCGPRPPTSPATDAVEMMEPPVPPRSLASPIPLAAPVITATWPLRRALLPMRWRLGGPPDVCFVGRAVAGGPEPRHLADIDEPQVPLVTLGRPSRGGAEIAAVAVPG